MCKHDLMQTLANKVEAFNALYAKFKWKDLEAC